MFTVFLFVERNSKLQTIDEENPETLKLLSEKENAGVYKFGRYKKNNLCN